MREWVYSKAARCGACDERAIVPTLEAAKRFILKSEGRLEIVECRIGNGWHLMHPAVESVPPR